jgi:hypothetical protein
MLALPTAALANKRVYQARLTTGAELHQVVGSRASGSAIIATDLDGSLYFAMQVFNLSGGATAAHIHAPATTAQNAGVKVGLCGSASSALVTCTMDGSTLVIEGKITSALLAQLGVSPADLMYWLDNGLAYVNVHTALNPAGEARGQVYPR